MSFVAPWMRGTAAAGIPIIHLFIADTQDSVAAMSFLLVSMNKPAAS